MSDPYIYQLASQRIGYLSARQSMIASNVANANTPGFKAMDMKPFAASLQDAALAMTTTNAAHLTPTATETSAAAAREADDFETTVSGNSVDIEGEMVKLGEVNRDFSEATGIKRFFHQIMMQALK